MSPGYHLDDMESLSYACQAPEMAMRVGLQICEKGILLSVFQ